jgi:tricorn protease
MMRLFLVGLFFLMPIHTLASDLYFPSKPTLTPDGSTIFFAYEGDIWKVATSGGSAERVTAMDGNETSPRVSPDGKWLAFAGSQEGNANVYIMPIQGGTVRQLTIHDANDEPVSWAWDSQSILFNSNRYNGISTYRIGLNGGTPQRLFNHYFNLPHDAVQHPTSGDIVFTDTWESFRFQQRKRYRGAFNPDLKSYNLQSKTYRQITDFDGKDMFPTIDRNGNMYFVSDRDNEEYDLYKYTNGNAERLTRFETSIYYPQVSADGSKIAFTRDYQLWVYDTATKQAKKVPVTVNAINTIELSREFKTGGSITNFDVSGDGKKLAFVSRGVLFVSDIKGKFVRRMPVVGHERVVAVHWMSDNKSLLYSRTNKGWENLFTISADGSAPEKQITQSRGDDRNLTWNSDKSKAVFLSGRNDVVVLDAKTMKTEVVASDELWGFYNSDPVFSPDDRWIAFASIRNFEREIMLVDLENKKTINLTNTFVAEDAPTWSPDGKYLYFHSNRTSPTYPSGGGNASVYRIPLEKFGPDFGSDNFDKLFAAADTTKKSSSTKPVVSIDFNDIHKRWQRMGPNSGSQSIVKVLAKDGEHTLIYTSNHDATPTNLWKTVLTPFESPKTEKIKGALGGFGLVEANNAYYTLVRGDIHIVKLAANDTEKITIDEAFYKNLREEFDQMFYETWANMDENFYSGDFHGVNWETMKARYLQYLPHVSTRDQLRQLTNDLLGELNASHLGFNSFGQEESIFYTSRSMETGIMFRNDAPFTVDRIVAQSAADNKDIDVRPGDVLVSVNGVDINTSMNRESYFQNPGLLKELNLGFKRGNNSFNVKVSPMSAGALRNLLYDEWMDSNQSIVDADGNGRIAYIHMKNMGGGELERFQIEMANEAQGRDALILDLRNNTGGNVHDAVLQLLSQREYLKWSFRDGAKTSQPNFTPADKPIVLLVNEQSLSDAEMTTEGFKALGLGTVIGTETYRWIIFTTSLGLVDGSSHRMPAWGCYGLDGRNLEREGVAPDVYIRNTFEDNHLGRDPQLAKAIEVILQDLGSR